MSQNVLTIYEIIFHLSYTKNQLFVPGWIDIF